MLAVCTASIIFAYFLVKNYKTITKVPAVIKIEPMSDFVLNSSCRKTNASTRVKRTLNLSIGTTFETSPIWIAL